MKPSLTQRVDCQVKCNWKIFFCATTRETESETVTSDEDNGRRCRDDVATMSKKSQKDVESKAEPNFNEAEILTLIEYLQRNPA